MSIEFDIIEAKTVGNNSVVFRLEDGTQVIVRVEIGRCGKRLDENGEAQYHFDFQNQVKIIPKDKKFRVNQVKNLKPKDDYSK